MSREPGPISGKWPWELPVIMAGNGADTVAAHDHGKAGGPLFLMANHCQGMYFRCLGCGGHYWPRPNLWQMPDD